MTLYKWSQIASSDATADPTINWAEGQAPSSINDSARAMMAATAKYRDDIAGAIVTGGTSTAYTVSSYEAFDALLHLNGQMIAFTPHATNGAGPVTLNVDSLGAKPLRSAPNADLPAGTIIQGTPYVAVYNNSDQVFYLRGFFGNPYNVPLAAGLDYWAPTAPNSSFAFPYGQAISRPTYASLFALIGTTYGGGDGSTTFNLPDLRGRVVACPDNMGGTTANRLANGSMASARHTLGGAAGADTHTLTAAEAPALSGTTAGSSSSATFYVADFNYIGGAAGAGTFTNSGFINNTPNGGPLAGPKTITMSVSLPSVSVSVNSGGGSAHDNLQPTILANRIIRII